MTRNSTLLIGALGASLVALATGSAGACTLQMVGELKANLSTGVPIVNGEINGLPTKIMIDTGAATTTITRSEAANLGLTTSASAGGGYVFGSGGQTYATVLKSLKMGTLTSTSLPPIGVGPDVETQPDIGLRVGEDLLGQFDVELDLADDVIRLFQADNCTPPQLVYWNKPYSQAALAAGSGIETEVSLNGRPVLAAVDTGAPDSLIDASVAARAGAGPLAIGDESIAHARLKVAVQARGAPSMLIGEDFLHAHRVMVDAKDRVMVFSYNGGPIFSAAQTQTP